MLDLNIDDIKIGVRIDHDFDDEYIENVLLPAAERQVQGAITGYGVDTSFYKDNALYNLAVINHIGHHYENRSITSQFEKNEIPASSLAMIQSLRGEYAKWKSVDLNKESKS
ncbi:head-tail connector protein [Staphylococcus caprae]|uniref:head-tail connector protein n=1 Tax=Staphylococcus caprae TaxID=29380 RepID=UPI001C83E45A|nr:head-tail connector protein [Staphylococcus caprae]MBX5315959.1 phage gp6-like head-tail connector protein [Staphylococcus caprae]